MSSTDPAWSCGGTEGGDSVVQRIFGPIIERRGRWKFVSYANKLD